MNTGGNALDSKNSKESLRDSDADPDDSDDHGGALAKKMASRGRAKEIAADDK